jgi:hypothetical protein
MNIRPPRACLVQPISGCDRIEVGHAARLRSIAWADAARADLLAQFPGLRNIN